MHELRNNKHFNGTELWTYMKNVKTRLFACSQGNKVPKHTSTLTQYLFSYSFPGVITLQIENVTRFNNCQGKTMKAKAFNDLL